MRKSRVVLLLMMSVLLVCFSIGCKSEPSTAKPQATNYTVTFNANGGSGTMPAQTFAKDETKALSANTFTMTNKVFTGWNTKADGTGTSYTDGQSYTATANITLYAQWRDPYNYIVTFDKNDGSGTTETKTQTFKEGQEQNLKAFASMFTTSDAMKFVSWNTKADGSGTTYTDEQSYKATENITLYARWGDFAYLCFTAEEANSTVGMSKHGTLVNIPTLEYSADGLNWTDFEIGTTVTLANIRDKFYLRGNNDTFSESGGNYLQFVMTGKIAASGNIMSLLDKNCELESLESKSYCFSYLFYLCYSLTTAPELPATTLSESCYYMMFYDCTSLTEAPELPATTLADYCYCDMFGRCTSLVEAPELPAMTLANYCYGNMFLDCKLLTEAPELPATTLAEGCYWKMFGGCISLTTAPELPATTLAKSCYSSMFTECVSLIVIPSLPALRLARYCYEYMFSYCTSLKVSLVRSADCPNAFGFFVDEAPGWAEGMFGHIGNPFEGSLTVKQIYYTNATPFITPVIL